LEYLKVIGWDIKAVVRHPRLTASLLIRPHPVGGKFEGCVEEVDSGKSQRFASVEEFLSFLQRCLGDHKYVGR